MEISFSTFKMASVQLFWFSQVICVLISDVLWTHAAQIHPSPAQDITTRKILVILTNIDKMTTSGRSTGWYLPELAHPYKLLVDAGFELESISPKGGQAPVGPRSVIQYKDDPVCQWFLADEKAQDLVNNTKTVSQINPMYVVVNNTKTLNQINPSDFAGVLYPGGHGPMFDLASDLTIADITSQIFDKGGVVAALCHGPAGLVPVKINGEPIVKGRKVTAFSNAEEDQEQLSSSMPFMLETKLRELGGQYSAAAALWQAHVVVDGRLITGQNPNSAEGVGQAMLALLN